MPLDAASLADEDPVNCEHIRRRHSGVDPDPELPGAVPVFLSELWPVPHRSLRRRFCTLWSETVAPDQGLVT